MLQAADYTNLSDGLYEIGFGSVLGRRIGYQGGWTDLGDTEMFTINITPTRKQRWSKKGKRANLAKEVTTRLEAVITCKFMQKTGLIRGAAMMGKVLDVVQAPGVIAPVPVMLRAGEYLYLGAYNISAPAVQYTGATLKAFPPQYIRLADPALGVVQITGLPADAVLTDDGFCLGSYGATVDAADTTRTDTRVDIGNDSDLAIELMVRNESDIGPKGYLHIFSANLAPDGDQGMITANEDFDGVQLKGRAADTNQGIGYWRSLAA